MFCALHDMCAAGHAMLIREVLYYEQGGGLKIWGLTKQGGLVHRDLRYRCVCVHFFYESMLSQCIS